MHGVAHVIMNAPIYIYIYIYIINVDHKFLIKYFILHVW
jgi:hypothetical protein